MVDSNTDMLAKNLVRLLGKVRELYDELARLMRGKLEAIRRADSDQMQSLTAREMMLAERVREREGLRRQLTESIVRGLKLDPAKHRTLKMTELAEHFPEPRRSQLLVIAAGLREKLEEIERMHITTTLISREMLKHLEAIFSVMKTPAATGEVYSRTGQRQAGGAARVFEAVG